MSEHSSQDEQLHELKTSIKRLPPPLPKERPASKISFTPNNELSNVLNKNVLNELSPMATNVANHTKYSPIPLIQEENIDDTKFSFKQLKQQTSSDPNQNHLKFINTLKRKPSLPTPASSKNLIQTQTINNNQASSAQNQDLNKATQRRKTASTLIPDFHNSKLITKSNTLIKHFNILNNNRHSTNTKSSLNIPQKSQIVVQFANDNTDQLKINTNKSQELKKDLELVDSNEASIQKEPNSLLINNKLLIKSKSLESINNSSELLSSNRSLTPTDKKILTANTDNKQVVRRKRQSKAINRDKTKIENSSTRDTSQSNVTAYQKLENLFGSELASKLRCDNTNLIKQNNTKMNSERNSIDSNNLNANDDNESDTSKTSTSSSILNTNNLNESNKLVDSEDIDRKKKQKLDEYYHIEEKQVNLLKILANVYRKLNDENAKQQQKLFDNEEFMKVFYVVVELEKLATLVHDQVSTQVKKRVELEWGEKSYFGDILLTYYRFYKVYQAILERYPVCQITLSSLLKKKNFALLLKKLLEAESESLQNVARLDMLLDRLVDFPRRCIQLLESYLKLLESNSKEFTDIKKVLQLFMEIFESSNEALNKMNNFQLCYELSYMFDQPLLSIVDQNRQLIKQGPIHKVAKRNGEILLRHLALFTDMLLVCKCDRIKRKLTINYQIPTSRIKLIVNSNDSNELMFRIVSADQNNEFKADKMKEKEDWMKAFRKAKDIEIIETVIKRDNDQISKIFDIGINPPIWIRDDEQTACSACKELFNAFRRRHHCRTCGRIYCSTCCSSFIPVKFNDFKEKVRVCRNCYYLLEPIYQDFVGQTSGDSNSHMQSSSHSSSLNPSNIANATLALANDLFKNFNGSLFNNHNVRESNQSENNKQAHMPVIKSKSVTSIGSTVKSTSSSEIKAILRKKNSEPDLDEEIASSPLNDEQLELIRPYLDGKDTDDSDDDDDDENSDEETNHCDTLSQKTTHSSDIEKLKLPKTKSLDELEIKEASLGISNVINRIKPNVPPKIQRSVPVSNYRRESLENINNNNNSNTNTYGSTVTVNNEATSKPSSKHVRGNLNLKKEILHSEYGYICKIPIQPKQNSLDEQIKEGDENELNNSMNNVSLNDSSTSNSTTNTINSNSNSSSVNSIYKWSREYLILYNDNTIGVFPSNNDTTNPSLVIQLGMFKLKQINETTFGLDLLDTGTAASTTIVTSNKNDKNNNSQNNTEIKNDTCIDSSPKLIATSSIGRLKSKLKLFESNFEIKFNKEESKNKWYELISKF